MYRLSRLNNGATLIHVPVRGTEALTVMALFPVGSRYETPHLSGASHFVEHMLFKGTQRRPTAVDISRTIEAYGADYNAFTNKDYTGYYIKIAAREYEAAFDLLSDMLFHSVLDEAEVEKEKGAIVEELRMYKDNPLMAVDLLSDNLVFGDTPLGWDIGGTEKTVRGLSRDDLWQYYQRHYSPRTMVVVVAGNTSPKVLTALKKYFGGQKAPKEATLPSFYPTGFKRWSWPEKSLPKTARVAAEERTLDQAQVMITFPGFPLAHKDRYAASLLLTILGTGMSSRLFVEVREKRGLAYMIRAGSNAFRDIGVSYIQAGLDPKRLSEAFTVIKAEVARIMAEPVTERELKDAKTSVAGRMALSFEDSSTQAEWYAKEHVFQKDIRTPEVVLKALKQVTAADIQRVAKTIFPWQNARVAVIGPCSKQSIVSLL